MCTMVAAFGFIAALAYGGFLIWGGVTAIRVLSRLVTPSLPAPFLCLRQASIWSVGSASTVIGLAVVFQGLTLIDHISQ